MTPKFPAHRVRSMLSPDIIAKTVWVQWVPGEWIAVRMSGEHIASHQYQECLLRDLRLLASDPANSIDAIAVVSPARRRKPKTNKPSTPARPR